MSEKMLEKTCYKKSTKICLKSSTTRSTPYPLWDQYHPRRLPIRYTRSLAHALASPNRLRACPLAASRWPSQSILCPKPCRVLEAILCVLMACYWMRLGCVQTCPCCWMGRRLAVGLACPSVDRGKGESNARGAMRKEKGKGLTLPMWLMLSIAHPSIYCPLFAVHDKEDVSKMAFMHALIVVYIFWFRTLIDKANDAVGVTTYPLDSIKGTCSSQWIVRFQFAKEDKARDCHNAVLFDFNHAHACIPFG